MSARIEAVFERGRFRPLEPVDFAEGERVQLTVALSDSDNSTLPPTIADTSERARLLNELVSEMKAHPLSINAPKLTRDEFHDRR